MTTETNIIRTIINKFEGRCYRCGCTVRRGNGLAEQVVDSRTGGTKWQNRHDDNCCYTKADGMGWVRDNAQWERKTGIVIPLPEAPRAEVVEAVVEVVEAPKAEVVEVDVFAADVLEAVEAKPARRQSRKTYGVSHRHVCDQDWIDMLNDADPSEAELAAAEAEVEAAETAEAAEIAASEDAIEIAPVVVAQPTTLRLYRLAVLCKTCFMRTKSAATEIAHHSWCHTREQSAELLETLQDKIATSLAKRLQTKAAKLNAKIDSLRDAYSAVYASVGGHSALGIHKISGTTGLHTVRAYEGTCTCPGHKAHGHCKHLRLVRDARDTMQSIKRQLRDTSDRLLAMAERATQANCEW